MFVSWRADPALPGAVTDKITVTSATFQIDRLEVVGDAGVDARTTRSKYLLSWDPGGKPSKESFPQAPVGVYSKINVVMAVGNLSENLYEIRGTWTDSGAAPQSFRIRDRGLSLSSAVDCDKTLPAAGTANITLRLDLANALNGINFKMLEDEEGELELRDGPQLVAFRMRLRDAFELGEDE
ncbi:MAG TPA: hypothetical protein VFD36_17815 [Kofleriaceae bacterium]|nr:hypothetical protein [Kofleriaceae bacterium]